MPERDVPASSVSITYSTTGAGGAACGSVPAKYSSKLLTPSPSASRPASAASSGFKPLFTSKKSSMPSASVSELRGFVPNVSTSSPSSKPSPSESGFRGSVPAVTSPSLFKPSLSSSSKPGDNTTLMVAVAVLTPPLLSVAVAVTACTPSDGVKVKLLPVTLRPLRSSSQLICALKSPSSVSMAVAVKVICSPSVRFAEFVDIVMTGKSLTGPTRTKRAASAPI